ncbi:MAG: fused MFS/spermidine synthase, partial [Pseudomonadota bacterium]
PGFFSAKPSDWIRESMIAIAILVLLFAPGVLGGFKWAGDAPLMYLGLVIAMGAAIILSRTRPVRLVALVVTALIAGNEAIHQSQKGENLRGFFGVNRIIESKNGKFLLLAHGTTIHGAQKLNLGESEAPEPLTYYHKAGPFADAINAARSIRPLKTVGVIGLGAGTLACYKRSGETWKFFEIDPLVIQIAKDPEKFKFLSRCAPNSEIVLGDARLTVAKEQDRQFNLLMVDAFSSDAIPVHLLTREALQIYLSKLTDDGVLLLHISNRNMDLGPVVAAAARELGLVALIRRSEVSAPEQDAYKTPAIVAVLARNAADIEALKNNEDWSVVKDPGWRVWTDDYSNVLAAILAKVTKDKTGEAQAASKD